MLCCARLAAKCQRARGEAGAVGIRPGSRCTANKGTVGPLLVDEPLRRPGESRIHPGDAIGFGGTHGPYGDRGGIGVGLARIEVEPEIARLALLLEQEVTHVVDLGRGGFGETFKTVGLIQEIGVVRQNGRIGVAGNVAVFQPAFVAATWFDRSLHG